MFNVFLNVTTNKSWTAQIIGLLWRESVASKYPQKLRVLQKVLLYYKVIIRYWSLIQIPGYDQYLGPYHLPGSWFSHYCPLQNPSTVMTYWRITSKALCTQARSNRVMQRFLYHQCKYHRYFSIYSSNFVNPFESEFILGNIIFTNVFRNFSTLRCCLSGGKQRTCIFYISNTIIVDVLSTHGARASAAMM